MADIPDRDELERQYARLMARLLAAYGGRLLEALGDPPSLSNIPPEFWDEEAKQMLDALSPFGERVYLDAARRMIADSPVGVDWALVNQGAVAWSRKYTFDFVKGLQETDKESVRKAIEILQQSVSGYFEKPMTIGELETRIRQAVASPVRAEMIAVTEITRAASQGEQELARSLAAEGINMTPYWATNNDELACPICLPKNGNEITDGEYPPAHPRCRCWVNHRLPKPAKR